MRRIVRAGAALLVTGSLVGVAPVVVRPAAGAGVDRQAGGFPAFTVDGTPTLTREVVADLVTLARTGQLDVVTVNDAGVRVPIPGVVATWLTKLIHFAVARAELERRGVAITARDRALGQRFERHAYGSVVWAAFPPRFRNRQVERVAGVIALAADDGLDLTKRLQTRRAVVALVTELARHASVTVAPRFGTWNAELAVVVPPTQGPAS